VRSYHLLRTWWRAIACFWAPSSTTRTTAPPAYRAQPVRRHARASRWTRAGRALRSLSALLSGEALSLPYYRRCRPAPMGGRTVPEHAIDAAVVFSSSMAQYAEAATCRRAAAAGRLCRRRFRQVGPVRRPSAAGRCPGSMRREGRCLLAYERALAAAGDAPSSSPTRSPTLFRRWRPKCSAECADRWATASMPTSSRPIRRANPFAAGETAARVHRRHGLLAQRRRGVLVCHRGAAGLRARWPALRFVVVGRSPPPAVQALAGEAVSGHRHRARRAPLPAACAGGRGAAAPGARRAEQGAGGHGHGAAGGRRGGLRRGHRCPLRAQHRRVLREPTTTSEAVSTLLEDPTRASQVGAAGRDCVLQATAGMPTWRAFDSYLPVAAGAAA
jgi:hypothetical protein